MYKLLISTIFFLLVFSANVFCQSTDSTHQIDITILSQVNQGNSYITFPTDIGNIEPLWFEGNLSANFYLRKSLNSHLVGVFTPQIILRMYQEESMPVRNPSYLPQLTVYYRLSHLKNYSRFNIFGRIAHHSNGQDGLFFLEDGSLNLKSGGFSTNFFEFGLITTIHKDRHKANFFIKNSFEFHPNSFIQPELLGIYSQYRLHNTIYLFKNTNLSNQSNANRPTFSFKADVSWMFGDYNLLKSISMERLNLSLTFYFHPVFLEDIGLFMQLYHGSDYYNMFFNHRLDILRFGLMTEKIQF